MRNKKEGKTEKQRSRETEIKKNAQNGKHIIPPQKNLCIYIYRYTHFLHKTLCIYNYIIICTRSIVYIIHIYIYIYTKYYFIVYYLIIYRFTNIYMVILGWNKLMY